MDTHAEAVYDELTDLQGALPALAGTRGDRGRSRSRDWCPRWTRWEPSERGRRRARKAVRSTRASSLRGVLRSPLAGSHLLDAMLRPTPRALQLLPEFSRQGVADLGSVRIERGNGAARLTMCADDYLNAEDNRQCRRHGDGRGPRSAQSGCPCRPVAGRRDEPSPLPWKASVQRRNTNLKALNDGGISLVGFLLRRELGYIHKLVRGIVVEDGPRWQSRQSRNRGSLPWMASPLAAGCNCCSCSTRARRLGRLFQPPGGPGRHRARRRQLPADQIRGAATVSTGNPRGTSDLASEPAARLVADEVVEPTDMDEAIERSLDRLMGRP